MKPKSNSGYKIDRRTMGGGIRSGGFTLMELMVGMVISLMAIAAIFRITSTIQKTYNAHDARTSVQQSARAALDYMGYFIRTAGYDPRMIMTNSCSTHLTRPGIESNMWSSHSLEITADSQADCDATDDVDDHIRFAYDSDTKTLNRVDIIGTTPPVETSYVILDDVGDFTFKYYDNTGTEVVPGAVGASVDQISYIEMQIVAHQPVGTGVTGATQADPTGYSKRRNYAEKVLTMRIRPRNLLNF